LGAFERFIGHQTNSVKRKKKVQNMTRIKCHQKQNTQNKPGKLDDNAKNVKKDLLYVHETIRKLKYCGTVM